MNTETKVNVPQNAKVEINGDQLRVTPENNFNGDIDVLVYVDDGTSKDKIKFVLNPP